MYLGESILPMVSLGDRQGSAKVLNARLSQYECLYQIVSEEAIHRPNDDGFSLDSRSKICSLVLRAPLQHSQLSFLKSNIQIIQNTTQLLQI
jgi:hypothetical protein